MGFIVLFDLFYLSFLCVKESVNVVVKVTKLEVEPTKVHPVRQTLTLLNCPENIFTSTNTTFEFTYTHTHTLG